MSHLLTAPVRFWHGLTSERRSFTVEAYLALQAVLFGAWLLAPWSTFGQVPEVYDTLGIVPEAVWGIVFVGHGLLHLWALDRGDMVLRRRGTSVIVFLWLLVLCAFLTTTPLSTTTPTYLAPVLAGLWAYSRHTRNGMEARP